MRINSFSKKALFLLTVHLLLVSKSLTARQSATGNLRNYNAVLTTNNNEYLVGRNRLTLNLKYQLENGSLYISSEVLNTYTRSVNNAVYDLGEAYFDLYLNSIDLRIGKQVITYGRADGVFISDIISPLDLSEFLTQPVSVIKIGIPAVKATRYFGSNYLELIATPVFQSNTFASPGERWFPFSQLERGNTLMISYPGYTRETTQALFQGVIRYAYRENLDWDLDLMAMLWSEGSPSFYKDYAITGTPPSPSFELTKRYLRRLVLSYSGNYIISDKLLLKSESAFHFQKYFDYLPQVLQDSEPEELSPSERASLNQQLSQNDDGFLKKKPWLVAMAGLQYELSDWSITGQYIYERVFNYEPVILQKENFHYSTLQIRRSFMRDKLTVSGFGRYHFTGRDFWVNPEITYEISDGIEAETGLHLFSAENSERFYGHFSFDDYKSNSFGYLAITAYF